MTAIDYARANREHRVLKGALTRAVKTGDLDKVREACRKAVAAWDAWGCWPDDWSRWQRALNDLEHWSAPTDLRDLA